jgi:hypothetical protein
VDLGLFMPLLAPPSHRTQRRRVPPCGGAAAKGFRPRASFAAEPSVEALIEGWPSRLDTRLKTALGIMPAADLDEIVAAFLAAAP